MQYQWRAYCVVYTPPAIVRQAGTGPRRMSLRSRPKPAQIRRMSVARAVSRLPGKGRSAGNPMPSSRPCSGPMGIPGPGQPGWTRASAGPALVVCGHHFKTGSYAILSSPYSGSRLIAIPHALFRVRRRNLPDASEKRASLSCHTVGVADGRRPQPGRGPYL